MKARAPGISVRFGMFLLAALAWLPAPVRADILQLEGGEKIEGFYSGEVGDRVIMILWDGSRREVPTANVKRLEMGYTGVPLCYGLRGNEDAEELRCNVLLHKVTNDRMVIAEGPGYTTLTEIPLEDVAVAQLRRRADFQRLAPVLRPGLRVRAQDRNGAEISGEIVDVSDAGVRLRDEAGEERLVREDQVALMAITKTETEQKPDPLREPEGETEKQPDEPEIASRRFSAWDLYPGIPQYRAGERLLGAAIAASFHVMLGGFYLEFRAAEDAATRADSDPTVLLFNNTTYLEDFQRHQRNQTILGGLVAAVYFWHLTDWFYLGPPEAASTEAAPALMLYERKLTDGLHEESVHELRLEWRF